MGVNGAGKSTLLKLIAGETAPDDGAVNVGAERQARLLRAARDGASSSRRRPSTQTLEEAFPLASVGALKTLAGCFGFSGDDVDKSCRVLSGGEKARLVLARILYDRPNFLVLDEPTNHLDMATKDMIVRALADYEGTMLFVSHDRQFLAELSNRVLELGPDGPDALRRRLPGVRRAQRPRGARGCASGRARRDQRPSKIVDAAGGPTRAPLSERLGRLQQPAGHPGHEPHLSAQATHVHAHPHQGHVVVVANEAVGLARPLELAPAACAATRAEQPLPLVVKPGRQRHHALPAR